MLRKNQIKHIVYIIFSEIIASQRRYSIRLGIYRVYKL